MQTYEGLGTFYLGKTVKSEMSPQEQDGAWFLYDSNDLTTHALCVGMTGSGKTGLGIAILEEAAIDGIPAIVIDPKGDLGNLKLNFEDPSPQDFIDWMPAGEKAEYADEESLQRHGEELYKKHIEGLSEFDQNASRAALIKEKCEVKVYTPGSSKGTPLSIMGMFSSSAAGPEAGPEALSDLISGNTSALLSLVGIEADPLSSPEHIFISNILRHRRNAGLETGPAELVQDIINPPFDKLGVLSVDSYYPPAQREKLARKINGLLASPDFAPWLQGDELNISRLLYNRNGKPKISVINTAHLSEDRKMFFTALLLNMILAYIRQRPGSSALKAIIYMDEIAGYIPPVANPPSKAPLMKLLKQARAFGFGLVLATQNPGDIDYKGLSNIGTRFIGVLNTARDRAKLLEGFKTGGMQDASGKFSEEDADKIISSLKKREFVMSNAGEAEPVIFKSRYCLSYLRGPLTPDEIARLSEKTATADQTKVSKVSKGGKAKVLNAGQPTANFASADNENEGILSPRVEDMEVTASTADGSRPELIQSSASYIAPTATTAARAQTGREDRDDIPGGSREAAAARTITGYDKASSVVRALPSEINVYFEPDNGMSFSYYEPFVLGKVQVYFEDKKNDIGETEYFYYVADFSDKEATGVNWDQSIETDLNEDQLLIEGKENIPVKPLPEVLYDSKKIKRRADALKDYAYRNCRMGVFHNPDFKLYSKPGESERDFKIRINEESKDERQVDIDKLKEKYKRKIETAGKAVQRKKIAMEKKERMSEDAKRQSLFSVGNAVFSALLGRKKFSSGNIGKAATAGKSISRTGVKTSDAETAKEEYEAAIEKLEEIKEEFEVKLEELREKYNAMSENTRIHEIKPLKGNINVKFVAVLMRPDCKLK